MEKCCQNRRAIAAGSLDGNVQCETLSSRNASGEAAVTGSLSVKSTGRIEEKSATVASLLKLEECVGSLSREKQKTYLLLLWENCRTFVNNSIQNFQTDKKLHEVSRLSRW